MFLLIKVDGHMHDIKTEMQSSYEEAKARVEELVEWLTGSTLDELLESGDAESKDDEGYVSVYYRGDTYEYKIEEIAALVSIPLSDGYAIVAERNPDDKYKEMIVGLRDPDGNWYQDFVIVGEHYHYNDDGDAVPNSGEYGIRVFSDENNEDYTHRFDVKRYCAD